MPLTSCFSDSPCSGLLSCHKPQNTPAPTSPSAFKGFVILNWGFSTHWSLLCKIQSNREKPPQCQRLREGFRSAQAFGLSGAVLGLSAALTSLFFFYLVMTKIMECVKCRVRMPSLRGILQGMESSLSVYLACCWFFFSDMVRPGTSAVPWPRDYRPTESQLFLSKAPPLSYTLFKLQLKSLVFTLHILGKAALP